MDVAVVSIAVVAGTFAREPFAFTRPQFWAEDGTVFFLDAYLHRWGAALRPYAGYYSLYQRLAAALVTPLPVRWVPAGFVAMNVLAQLVVAWLCVSARLRLPRWVRVALGASVTLAPTYNEVFNKLVNAQWFLALAPLVVLAYDPPRTIREWAVDVATVALSGLTGPFSIVYVPLFLAGALSRPRQVHAWALLALDGACALLQARHLAFTRTPGPVHWSVDHLRALNGMFGHLVAGHWGKPAPLGAAWNVAWLVSSVIVVAFLGWRAAAERQRPALVFLAGGLSVLASASYAFRSSPNLLVDGCERYWYVPTVALVWTALATWRRGERLRRQLVPAGLLAVAVVSSALEFQAPTLAAVDRYWPEASRCIGVEHPCSVTINPGWTLTLP